MAKVFDASTLSPKQAYDEYAKQDGIAKKANRIKSSIREEWLPMVMENKNVFVIGKDDGGKEQGFELNIRRSFNKKTFTDLCLKEYGKKMTDRIMGLFDDSKVGESKSFGLF